MWTNADRGRSWLAKCGNPFGKKIIATIFVKLTPIICQYVCLYKIFILLVFNRECMKRSVMTSFRIWSSFACFLRYFQTEWSVFLSFSVNCSQVAMFQIMPALCPHGQGEGVVNQMWTGLDRGRASQKFQNLCGHSLWMTPKVDS